MSKLRFMGTLKEIEYSSSSSKRLKFIPDQECAVVEKEGKDETRFVVLLPVDVKERLSEADTGIVFAYGEKVCICLETSKSEWLPIWKVKTHYKIVVELDDKKKTNRTKVKADSETSEDLNGVTITVEGACLSEQFQLVSVSEME